MHGVEGWTICLQMCLCVWEYANEVLAAVNKRRKKVNPDRSTAYGWSSKTNPKCWLLWPLPPLPWTSRVRLPETAHVPPKLPVPQLGSLLRFFFFVILVWTNDEIRIRSGEKHLALEPCQREGGRDQLLLLSTCIPSGSSCFILDLTEEFVHDC